MDVLYHLVNVCGGPSVQSSWMGCLGIAIVRAFDVSDICNSESENNSTFPEKPRC
jgi:hypothetical protein